MKVIQERKRLDSSLPMPVTPGCLFAYNFTAPAKWCKLSAEKDSPEFFAKKVRLFPFQAPGNSSGKGLRIFRGLNGKAQIAMFPALRQPDPVSEFVRADDSLPLLIIRIICQRKNKGPAVRVASTPRIPILVSHAGDTAILCRQPRQRGVNGLFLRANKPYLHVTVVKGKDLGPQHGCVCDAYQLKLVLVKIVPRNDEKPRSVRGTVDMGGLNKVVDLLLFRRKLIEVHLSGGRQGLNDIFERIPVHPVQEIKDEH
jgi:hypothetical protein